MAEEIESFDPRGRDQIPPVELNSDAYDPRGRNQIPPVELNPDAYDPRGRNQIPNTSTLPGASSRTGDSGQTTQYDGDESVNPTVAGPNGANPSHGRTARRLFEQAITCGTRTVGAGGTLGAPGATPANPVELTPGAPSPGMTPERAAAIRDLAERYNMNPNALAGILNIESGLDPNIQGGYNNNYYGIFQLQGAQIPGLTQQALGQSLTPSQYRSLSFEDQLSVYEQYITNAGASPSFFTGDAGQDASRLWALQLAPSNATRINYNDPNAVISRTNQANAIEAREGLVTVGSVQAATVSRGGLE